MSWLILAFASAVFLGLYDLAKKKSVQRFMMSAKTLLFLPKAEARIIKR